MGQAHDISEHLIKHTFIDQRIALELYGVQCLSKIISQLRRFVKIRIEKQFWVDKATGRATTFARYHLGGQA